MSSLLEFLPPLVFDHKRVASAAIEGYGYQILQTVNAWLDLSDGDLLFVEGAEDIDILYKDGSVEPIQVKRTIANITLASEPVVAAIANFWRHRANNKNRNLHLRYLTTSKVTLEKGDPFGGIPGLALWEQTRSDKNLANVARLKQFLLGFSKLPGELTAFLKKATDAELLAELILPIAWQTSAPDSDRLLNDVEIKLIKLGKSRPVPPPAAASASAVEKLFFETYNAATKKVDRVLTHDHLLKVFDSATGVWAPAGALRSKLPVDHDEYRPNWFALAVPVMSGAIVWWISDVNPLKLLAVAAGLIGVVGFLLFRRNFEILGYGSDLPGSPRFRAYQKFRALLSEGGLFQWIFYHGIQNFLQGLKRFFLDAGKRSSTLSRRPFGLTDDSPLWTATAFDRCLLIAAIYPLTSIIFFWSIHPHVSQAQAVLHLPQGLESWQQGLIFGILVGEIIAIWNMGRGGSWHSVIWAVSGGTLAMAAVVGTTGAGNLRVAGIFLVGGLTAGAVGALLTTSRVQFAGSVSGAGALGGLLAGAIAFGYLGTYHWILGGIGGGAASLIVIGGLTAYKDKIFKNHRQGAIQVVGLISMIAACLVAAYFLSQFGTTWGTSGPMLMFLVLLPLLNAPFDWASVGLTRALLHRGLELKGWWPLIYALIDATCSVVLIACLALTLVAGITIFNRVGAPVLEITPIINGLKTNASSPEWWWVYGMLLSTLIPSAINLMIGGTSLVCGVPGLPSYLFSKVPKSQAPDPALRTALALAWTLQIVGGALLGLAVLAGLVYLVYGIVLPALGSGLLTMCVQAFTTLNALLS